MTNPACYYERAAGNNVGDTLHSADIFWGDIFARLIGEPDLGAIAHQIARVG